MESQPSNQQKITPFLWFHDQAEEAVNYYASVFKNCQIKSMTHYSNDFPGFAGKVMTIAFTLNGQDFVALNGGPHYSFNEAISFVVDCETQEEIDDLWEKLTAGGEEGRCGWLKDQFGLSWQIVPPILGKLLGDKDAAKAKRVLDAMMQMKKIHTPTLQQAYEQEYSVTE